MRGRPVDPLLLALVATASLLELGLLALAWHTGDFAIDLERGFLPGARAVADGLSPYPQADDPAIATGAAYVYPPLLAFLLVPLASFSGASLVVCALLALCVPAALLLLGVRDPRCHAAAFLWAPVFSSLQTANVTLLLVLGAALVWWGRDRVVAAGLAAGVATALKILAWPLALWLAVTRRRSALAVALAAGALAVLGPWALIGLGELTRYREVLETLGEQQQPRSITPKALLLDLGLPPGVAAAGGVALAIVTVAGLVWYGLRREERRAFALACVAMVVASPIVWLHSFALLLPAVAVLRPRFSPVWLLPVLAFAGPGTGNGSTAQTALVLGVGATLMACSWQTTPRAGRLSRTSTAS